MLPLAILCGGLGTRMRPSTLTIPKAMIEVDGRPFIDLLLRFVAEQGIADVVLLIGYLGEAIVDYVGDGAAYGLRVRYMSDGERPAGTAGAVRCALPLLGERFFLTFGDAYLNVDYGQVGDAFARSGRSGLMTVYAWNARGSTPPNAAIADGLITRYDKETNAPDVQYVDYGLSAFHARAFGDLPAGEPVDLGTVNRRLIAAADLAAFVVPDIPFEIGSPEGLEAARSFLRRSS